MVNVIRGRMARVLALHDRNRNFSGVVSGKMRAAALPSADAKIIISFAAVGWELASQRGATSAPPTNSEPSGPPNL